MRLLGQGGFASVYLGQHVRIAAQQVAIKILHLFDVDAQKFQDEAETTATLEHPHIVRLFDFHIEQGTPVLVMAYAPNGSLRTRHASGTQVPLASVVQYVKEIASALQYAHEQNIIHRDIKPENMLIGRHGELLLSDFGISVLSKTGRTTFQPTSYGIGGTALYMAPEQFRGKPEKASDQYALEHRRCTSGSVARRPLPKEILSNSATSTPMNQFPHCATTFPRSHLVWRQW